MKQARTIRFAALLLALWLAPAPLHAADTAHNEHTTLSLIAEKTGITTGEAEGFRVAVRIETQDRWHTYWENPGDAGLPTTLTWTLPEGFTASGIDWPAPSLLKEGPLATYAYEGTVLLPVTLTPPALSQEQDVTLKLHVDLLVCRDICVPESGDLELTLPVSSRPSAPSAHAPLFRRQNTRRVQAVDEPARFSRTEEAVTLSVPLASLAAAPGAAPPAPADIRAAQFFPREQHMFQYAADQKISGDRETLFLTIARAEGGEAPQRFSGILTLALPGGDRSFNLRFEDSPLPGRPAADAPGAPLFPVALLLALLGGLILNLMPCVLPVLSLKALALAGKSGHAQAQVRRQGLAYMSGIAVSFAALSGLLLILRAAGEAVGWGYQMQSPAFVAALAYLLFLVGLSLSGLFDLPVLLGGVGHAAAGAATARGSFLTGMLATAVATPCTAPFMAPALGAALTMPAWQSLLVFQALGFGLSLPYLLICLVPSLRRFLPRPGAWMERFKQLMAFPMYASVIWLLWVLVLQTGARGMVLASGVMLLLAFIIWLRDALLPRRTWYRRLAVLLCAALIGGSLHLFSALETAALPENPSAVHGLDSVPYSPEALAALRANGTPVYVDATAAWCITCQVNASLALHTPRSMAAFREHGVTLMIADWTRRDTQITEFLAGFGASGVPLNVFYPAGQPPVVLPQLLSEEIVIHTLTTKGP